MIANELERTVAEYLANVLLDGEEPIRVAPDQVVEIEQEDVPSVRLYRGQSNTEVQLPAIIVSCRSGQHDLLTPQGHNFVAGTFPVDVAVEWQADSFTGNTSPVESGQRFADELVSYMCTHDIVEKLNHHAGDKLTVRGLVGRSENQPDPQDRRLSQSITCELYCYAYPFGMPI